MIRTLHGCPSPKSQPRKKVARFSSFATAWESLSLIKSWFQDREVLAARAGTGVRVCCAYVLCIRTGGNLIRLGSSIIAVVEASQSFLGKDPT